MHTDLHPCLNSVQFLGVAGRETTSLVAVGKGVLERYMLEGVLERYGETSSRLEVTYHAN